MGRVVRESPRVQGATQDGVGDSGELARTVVGEAPDSARRISDAF